LSSQTVIPETQLSQLDLSVIHDRQPLYLSVYFRPDESSALITLDNASSDSISIANEVSPCQYDGSSIETIVTDRAYSMTSATVSSNLHLFRGPRNPLSAFYVHPLKWNNMHFQSAEHAYQYQKLLFHNVSRANRDRLMRCRQSHDVKLLSKKLVPLCSAAWDKVKFDIMEDICTAKLSNCRRFRDVLLGTKDSELVHNTETDAVWGCGPDFKGRNMMGRILMQVRTKTISYDQDFPPLPAPTVSSAPEPSTTNTVTKSAIVIGNSNVRGLASEFNSRGIDCTGYAFPGRSSSQIEERLPYLSSNQEPDVVICHSGDIDIRDRTQPVTKVASDVISLVQKIQLQFPSSKVVVSSLPPVHRNRQLNDKIQSVNKELSKLCATTKNCFYLCNAKARLHDGIHLTNLAKDLLARTAAHFIKQCIY